jgi:integrase
MAKNTTIKGKNGKEYEYFRITRTIGHKYKEGKKIPIKKQFTGSSERDAERKYREWLSSNREEQVFDNFKTFGELAEFYTDNILAVNSKYSVGTRELYIRAYENHVKGKNITHCIMNELTSEQLQEFYNGLQISKSAMANVHKFMRGFMRWQSNNKYGSYLLDSVVIPEKPDRKRQEGIITWTDNEVRKILTVEPDYQLKPLIIFALYSGMRISEILGLHWSDISDDVIHVRRQYYRGSWCPPKGNKTRLIPIHNRIKEILDHAGEPDDLIFSTANGNPLDQKNINRSLDRFYNRNNIPHKKFHAYRATFITNLCRKGVPIQTVSKLAGHENINVTSKYYASVQLDEMEQAVKKL